MPSVVIVPVSQVSEFDHRLAGSCPEGYVLVTIPDAEEVLLAAPDREGQLRLHALDEPAAGRAATSIASDLTGVSPAVVLLRQTIKRVARFESNVLIMGETGTGKDLAASLIHRYSRRSSKPFVCVNCASIPEALAESELFGNERGAFTGADRRRRGWLEQADGGTFFLDEIGDMPQLLQAKLLRVLETRTFTRLGGDRAIKADIRFIAATNQNLESLIAERRFRSDLFFRLNVVRLDIPPLSARSEDIPLLIEEQLQRLAQRYSRTPEGVEPDLLPVLQRYNWPGNIRELMSFVESSFVLSRSGKICWQELPDHLKSKLAPFWQKSSPQRDRIVAALEQTRWNRSEAARLLGCSRMTLYRRMAKMQVSRTTAIPAN